MTPQLTRGHQPKWKKEVESLLTEYGESDGGGIFWRKSSGDTFSPSVVEVESLLTEYGESDGGGIFWRKSSGETFSPSVENLQVEDN